MQSFVCQHCLQNLDIFLPYIFLTPWFSPGSFLSLYKYISQHCTPTLPSISLFPFFKSSSIHAHQLPEMHDIFLSPLHLQIHFSHQTQVICFPFSKNPPSPSLEHSFFILGPSLQFIYFSSVSRIQTHLSNVSSYSVHSHNLHPPLPHLAVEEALSLFGVPQEGLEVEGLGQ